MKKILILIVCLIIPGYIFAQSHIDVKGVISSSGAPTPFINVYIKGTTLGTTTDKSGKYALQDLPKGKQTIIVQGIGYKTQTKIVETQASTITLDFDLEEDVLNLDNVVVTANRDLTKRAEAPMIVNTLSPALFESTQAVNVADVLDFTPGLRMECNCQNCGFTQVRMNGLDGSYSQILMNSRPVFSGLAGVYGLELIPTNMIQRVEVVRCGGSALYGGNAIAGTVNIITQDPVSNGFTIDARKAIIGVGNDHNTTPAHDDIISVNGSVVSENRKSGMFIYGLSRNRDSFDENGDDYTEHVAMNNLTLGMSGFFKPSATTKFMLDLYRIEEHRRGGNKLNYRPDQADIAEMVDHSINGASLSFDWFTNQESLNKLTLYVAGQSVDRSSYYGAEQDPNAYGTTEDFTSSIGAQYNWNFNNTSSLLLGIDNNHNALKDTKLGSDGDDNTTIVDQSVNTLGSFAQYDLKLSKVKFSMGLRYDNYLIQDHNGEDAQEDLSDGVLAPRATFLWDIAPNIQYRLSYAKGYRSPQIFDEDLHIEASGSRRILHANADDLTQETSHSVSSSLNFVNNISSTLTELLVEGFYTQLIDPFAYDYISVDSTNTLYSTRYNAEGGYVAGVNIEFNAAFPKGVTLQAGFTLQQSEYDNLQPWGEEESSTSKSFMRSPSSYGYLSLDWHVNKKFSVTLTGNYTGSMYVPHLGLEPISGTEQEYIDNGQIEQLVSTDRLKEIEAILAGDVIEGERLETSEDFFIVGIRASYDLKLGPDTKMQVYAGIKNISNQTQKTYDSGVYRDASYIYGPCQPRTIMIGIKIGNML